MKHIGDQGESFACRYLEKRGYKILERNYRVHHIGEIDIIAKQGEVYVFIEVKYRNSTAFGSAIESLTRRKLERCYRAMLRYCKQHDIREEFIRFDAIVCQKSGQEVEIEHIKSIEFFE